jgi:fatty acid desaturase
MLAAYAPGMQTDTRPTSVAARAATLMAYVVALVGAGAATLALRSGEVVPAVLVLTTTLGVAALLAATGTLLRGLEDVEARLRRLEDQVRSATR